MGSRIELVLSTAFAMSNPAKDFGQTSAQSFEQLFLSTYPRLVSILRRMLGDPARAEELANEAFLKLHSSVLPHAGKKNVAGWLYRTAMNLGIDDLRSRSRHHRWAQAESRSPAPASVADAFQLLLQADKQQRVRTVLAKLKPEWAQALMLKATGHSYKEIAAHLEIPAASVGTTLLRAEADFEKRYLELFGDKG